MPLPFTEDRMPLTHASCYYDLYTARTGWVQVKLVYADGECAPVRIRTTDGTDVELTGAEKDTVARYAQAYSQRHNIRHTSTTFA